MSVPPARKAPALEGSVPPGEVVPFASVPLITNVRVPFTIETLLESLVLEASFAMRLRYSESRFLSHPQTKYSWQRHNAGSASSRCEVTLKNDTLSANI